MIYYEVLKDGTIGRSTSNEKVAKANGYYDKSRVVDREGDIVYGYDNKRYLKGAEPQKPQSLIDKEIAEQRILELKELLLDSDYQALKHLEGYLTDYEYEPIKAQRQAWRDEINELEKLI